MSSSGDAELIVEARAALLDALDALIGHRDAVVVIGAQAVYLHTHEAPVALAEATKDSDIAVDPRTLAGQPLLEEAMRAAGFTLDEQDGQPGMWISPDGLPVDLMVPEALAGVGGRRGARIPPHGRRATRRATGLEAAVVDHRPMVIAALTPEDGRTHMANVASPAALLVAKLHKVADREGMRDRLADKDAHDIYRLLAAVPSEEFAEPLSRLRDDRLAGSVTRRAIDDLARLFADGPDALGSSMAGRAEYGIGDPDVVSASVAALSQDLLGSLQRLE